MLFLALILIIGVLTTFTDLKNKKIYNRHLAISAIIGLIITAYAVIFRHEHVLFHLINGLIAFLIGLILYQSALWRGGDAKLFALYAFLMPVPEYGQIPFPNVVSLFACSFIAGMIILIPFFIKDIIINHKAIANDLLLPTKRQAMFEGFATVTFFSWILFPFYYLARITSPFIILTASYLFFNWGGKIKKEAKKHYIIEFCRKKFIKISIGIIFGFFVRLWLSPNSLSFPALTRYIMMILLSTTLSICINTIFDHFKNHHERVPFAPLLFMGCVLSYTPFLTKIMHLMARWNSLFAR
ncbi:MAG: prepilin peptidase [Candidatus Omnitrophica bacterium]|nr:prepilin peptidase [Candidatus Omnitrophota bacterium]